MRKSWYQSCVTSFLIQFAVFGLHNNFGLFYRELIKEFNESRAATAWIGSLAMGATFIISPFANMIMACIGFKKLLIVSCLLCLSSLTATSFAQNVYIIAFTHSILLGFGSGIANHASLVSLQVNAKEKLSLANGISSSGSGIGTFVMGPYITFFINTYGFRWASRACLVLPLLFLSAIFCMDDFKSTATESSDYQVKYNCSNQSSVIEKESCLERKSSNDIDKPTQKKRKFIDIFKDGLNELIDRDIWKHIPYVVYIVGFSIFLFGYFIPFIFLVDHATSYGVPMEKAQFLVGILAIVATVVKVIGGAFLDMQKTINRTTLFLCSMFSMSLTQILAAYSTEYYQFVLFAVLFGISEGVLVGQVPNVVLDVILQKQKIGVALASLFAVISLPVTVGPVIAGNLSAESHGYRMPFLASAGVTFLGAIVTSLIKLFKTNSNVYETTCDEILWDDGDLLKHKPIFASTSLLTVTTTPLRRTSLSSTPFTRSYKYRTENSHVHTDVNIDII